MLVDLKQYFRIVNRLFKTELRFLSYSITIYGETVLLLRNETNKESETENQQFEELNFSTKPQF